MTIEFVPVKTAADQETLASMADVIWHEYWPDHIGAAQTDYMVEQFQSLEAIRRDMAEHDYEYWFIRVQEDETPSELGVNLHNTPQEIEGNGSPAPMPAQGRIVGYTGGHNEPETNRFFISKVYLYQQERGKGYASRTIEFYERLCRDRGLRAMYLTVNKYNEMGIRAYRAKGFETIDSVETDIGDGFIMDDFIMEKTV